jgi:hypothetical protein
MFLFIFEFPNDYLSPNTREDDDESGEQSGEGDVKGDCLK